MTEPRTGIEIDMVVKDSIKALTLYERIFEIHRIEVANFGKGLSEVFFTMYGGRFHLLDENPDYFMFAPKDGEIKSIWMNVFVPDISKTFEKALTTGCTVIRRVTEMTEFGVSNAMFADPFGYNWMLHQIHREVSFEERNKIFKEKLGDGR